MGTRFNKAEIMRRAHDLARTGLGPYRYLFKTALRMAWAEARRAMQSPADRLREAIQVLECKDRWSREDYATHDRLLAELRTLEVQASAEREQKRALIESAKGRICAVTFTKKDGSERVMKIQPAKLKFHIKGEDGDQAARKASAIRKSRHPHLMPVWDVEAAAPRSVNLATVSRIVVDGAAHRFAG